MQQQNMDDLANAIRRYYARQEVMNTRHDPALPLIVECMSRDLAAYGSPWHSPVTGRIMREHLRALSDLVPEIKITYDNHSRKIRLERKRECKLPLDQQLLIARRALQAAKDVIDRCQGGNEAQRVANGVPMRRFYNDCETLGVS